jgi:hypothetical protein
MPERVPAAPVQVTVHSIGCFFLRGAAMVHGRWSCAYGNQATFGDFLHLAIPQMLQCNKNARTIANKRAFLHASFVSSTL